jgi:hypothetical protein
MLGSDHFDRLSPRDVRSIARELLGTSSTARGARSSFALRLLCACLVAGALSACKLDEKPPAGAGLVVAIDTDMSMPKDIDELRLEVTQGMTVLFEHTQALAEGAQALPLDFQVPEAKESGPVLIRAIGLKDTLPRIERSAITTVPTSYLGYVRLILNFLCDGRAGANGESTCGGTETCIQGTCADAAITTSLPDYYERNNGMKENAASACFDVAKCLSNATEMTPDPAEGCSFASSKLFPTDINVAIRLDPGSAGVCSRTACWIVLDSDGDGFRIGNDERVFLPESICEQRAQGANLRIAMSMQCPSKTQSMPICREGQPGGEPGSGITVGTNTPPVSDACAGGGEQACEMCGSQARTCQSGLWSQFGTCADQGVCTPELVEACGASGIRTCGGDCTWGDCENQACDGPATRACGNCGTQHRSCNNGVFTEWSACAEEGECAPGSTQTCGSGGTQSCGGSCRWSACTMQVCPGADSQPCGFCGTQTRTCDSNTAQWSDWAECLGEGECRPDSSMPCGRDGTQTCGGSCRWDATCTGQSCEGPARRACGLCGTQTRTCDMNSGEYSDWSACFGEGECMPDAITSCGSGGERTCGGSCRWGRACTGQVCTGPSSQRCGDCGTQTRSCDTNSGTWSDWGSCSNEGDCSAGETRTCGAMGTQTCGSSCRWDTACPGQMCSGDSSRPCPNNPCLTQTRTCNTNAGTWSAWSSCVAGCTPGQRRPGDCVESAEQVCSNTCTWNSCTCSAGTEVCPGTGCVNTQDDERHCGRCGRACGVGESCVDGMCQCPAGQTNCGGTCVNTNTNGANCGECGMVCGGNAMCSGGDCVCPTSGGTQQTYCEASESCVNLRNDENNCGACGTRCTQRRECNDRMCACPANLRDCGAAVGCINPVDNNDHCGGCNMRCADGEMCVDGACSEVCRPDQIKCGRRCFDPQTSGQHCGTCGNTCANGQTCQGGTCRCPADSTQCTPSGECVPLNTMQNCGACGERCPMGATCDPVTGGRDCVCSQNRADCGGEACVDTQVDELNCGRCGVMCPDGSDCVGGECGCPRGTMMCDTGCENLNEDPLNCGRCGNSCGGRACMMGMCACSEGEHACDGQCMPRSVESCGPSCRPCGAMENREIVGCSPTDTCQYQCLYASCRNGEVCCAANEACGEGGACVPAVPTCTPEQHQCDGRCVARSVDSCGPSCEPCGAMPNREIVGCSETDICQYRCQYATCGTACCAEGQICNDAGACVAAPPVCNANQHLCNGRCVTRSAESCTDCAPCTPRTNQTATCTTGDVCEYACAYEECGDMCCGQNQICGEGCMDRPPTCGPSEHLCGNNCEPRSASSCTSACIPCAVMSNTNVSCNAADQCEYTCAFETCGNACCERGEMCLPGNVCGMPPSGGTGGPPPTTGGSGGEAGTGGGVAPP